MTRDDAGPLAAGALLVAAGILGFVPGVTTHHGELAFAGHGSGAKLLGVFRVSILLNLVHVAIGATVILRAHAVLVGAGVALLLLWLLGVVEAGGWIPLDAADDWLHLALAAAVLGLAAAGSRAP